MHDVLSKVIGLVPLKEVAVGVDVNGVIDPFKNPNRSLQLVGNFLLSQFNSLN